MFRKVSRNLNQKRGKTKENAGQTRRITLPGGTQTPDLHKAFTFGCVANILKRLMLVFLVFVFDVCLFLFIDLS